jgi:predicted DNA-binding transcriptional regulator AlpA
MAKKQKVTIELDLEVAQNLTLNGKNAALLLGCSESTFFKYDKENRIPRAPDRGYRFMDMYESDYNDIRRERLNENLKRLRQGHPRLELEKK